jgi:menaquinone-specific isochorismate synthase
MLRSLAFLQLGTDALARVDGPLDPVASPRAGSAALFAPDFAMSTDGPWWLDGSGEAPVVLSRDQWAGLFAAADLPPRPALAWSEPDEARFARGFASLERHLTSGALRKGVPVTVMSAPLSPEAACAVFQRALARVPGLPSRLFAYGFFRAAGTGGRPEFLIGATPELLFDTDGGRTLLTMAVAGTRRSEAGPAPLAESAKDRDEHQSVVDDLVTQLAAWGRPTASATEVRNFGQLEHLATDIRLESEVALDFEDVARRLHPTPALGVYPRSAAGRSWLASIDPAGERRRFGAPFGLRLPSGAGRCLVAIRNLQYGDGRLDIWAGCGVVSRSRYGEEWQEVLDKMQAVRALWDV